MKFNAGAHLIMPHHITGRKLKFKRSNEAIRPVVVSDCSEFHFGASTRRYIIRERPQQNTEAEETAWNKSYTGPANFGLPEDESELEHLTEYNTAQNRIIDKSSVGT